MMCAVRIGAANLENSYTAYMLVWATITKYYELGSLNERKLVSYSSGFWESMHRMLLDLASGEDLSSRLADDCPATMSSQGRDKASNGAVLCFPFRTLILVYQESILMSPTLINSFLQILLGLGFTMQMWEWTQCRASHSISDHVDPCPYGTYSAFIPSNSSFHHQL